jgi:hypothetical protein
MKDWEAIKSPGGHWLFSDKFITGTGSGTGEYYISYIISRSDGQILNGSISAKMKLKDWSKTGVGIVCRADEYGSFICFHTSPSESSKDKTVLRLSVINEYHFNPLISLKQEVQLDSGYNTFKLSFFSGEIEGTVFTSKNSYSIKQCVPNIPFAGYVGFVRFLRANLTIRDINIIILNCKDKLKTTMKTREFDVFLSHSSADKSIIKQIVSDFRKENINVWVDHEQINFGDNITGKIEEGLKKSKFIIVALSKNLGKSNWCRAEYGPILNKEYNGNSNKRVIPLKLDNCGDEDIPYLLYDKRRADYSNKEEYISLIKFIKE